MPIRRIGTSGEFMEFVNTFQEMISRILIGEYLVELES